MKNPYDKILDRLRYDTGAIRLACRFCMKDIVKMVFADLDKQVKFSAWKYEYAQIKEKYEVKQ